MSVTKVAGRQINLDEVADGLLGNYDFDTTQVPGPGTDNYVLTYDDVSGEIRLEVAPGAGGGIGNVVEDTTPQLGGNLDVQTFIINTSNVNGSISLQPNGTGDVILGNFTLDGDQTVGAGQDNYVLTYDDASGLISLEPAPGAGGGIGNVVEDLTPQLGGDLDVNGNSIVSVSNADINITPNGTGNVTLGNLAFDADQIVGVPQDNFVLTYDNGTGLISLEAAAAGGLANVVEDTTPQLGGNLDVQSFTINTSTVNGNITLTPNGTGDVQLGNFVFDGDQTVGVGQDNYVLTYDNAGGIISLEALPPSGLQNIVEDTTPQLGGNLDVQSQVITTSATNGNITLTPNGTGNVQLGNFILDGDQTVGAGQDNFVLTYDDASGLITLEASAGGGLANVVEDTTPQLGGNLDVNGNAINTSVVNGNIVVSPNGSGNVQLGNFVLDGDQTVGAGQDNYVLTYDDAAGVISLEPVAAGGGLDNVVEDTTPQLGGNLDVQSNVINTSTVNGGITLTPNGTGNVTLGTMTFDADQTIGAGQDNFVLTYDDASGLISLEASAGGGLGNVVEDTTPQLGGNLDVNGNSIVSVSNADINITPNGTGNVTLGNFAFDADQTIGAGQDNFVLTYDDASGLISLEAATGGGGLANIVEDTTPQLGGNLDVQTFAINTSTVNGDINITPNGTGSVVLGSTGNATLATTGSDTLSLLPGGDLIITPTTNQVTFGGDPVLTTTGSIQINADVNWDATSGGDITLSSGGGAGQDINLFAGALGNINFDNGSGQQVFQITPTPTAANGLILTAGTAGNGPTLSATGEVNADINLSPAGTGNVNLGNLTFDADQTVGAGQDNFVLTYDDAAGVISLEAAAAGGIANVVEDTTPQLGGDLDVNGNSIVSVSNGNINLTPDGTGQVVIGGAGTAILASDPGDSIELQSGGDIILTPDATGDVIINSSGAAQITTTGGENLELLPAGDLVLNYATFPAADGTTGQVLTTNGAGVLSWTTVAGGLANVVEDTTPQLGGNLDVQTFAINTSTVNGNITLTPNGTGNVQLGNFVFDGDQAVGAGQDNYVLTYDDAAGVISLEPAAGGGLANVVEDTTPQLGGDLDVNGNSIVSVSNGDINLTPDGTGAVVVGTGAGAGLIESGAGEDLTLSAGADIVLTPDITGQVILGSGTDVTISSDLTNDFTIASGADIILTPATGGSVIFGDGTDATLSSDPGEDFNINSGLNVVITPGGVGNVTLGNYVFDGDQTVGAGQDNFVLTYDDASGLITLEAAAGGGIANVVEDTTPQLGGNLDVQANVINTSTVNGDITLTPNGTGNVTLGTMTFDADQTIGAGQDNFVLTYDNGTGVISLEALPAGGISNVVEDTTPQLGGNLDVQTFSINTSTVNGDINITPNGTGSVVLGSTGNATVETTGGDDLTLRADGNLTAGTGSVIYYEQGTGTGNPIETVLTAFLDNATGASTTAIDYVVGTNDAVVFEVSAVARDGTDAAAFRIFGAADNIGGTTTLTGSNIVDRTDTGGNAVDWNITFTIVTSTTVRITVDSGAETVDWKLVMKATPILSEAN